MQRYRGTTEQFNVPDMVGGWGGKTKDEDKLGLTPIYKGPCVTDAGTWC